MLAPDLRQLVVARRRHGISVTDTVRDMDFWWRDAMTFWLALAIGAGLDRRDLRRRCGSRHGLALTAMRDSEVASESLGVSVAG